MATKKKSTALAQVKASDLLPEDVEYDELKENLEEMDEIEFPRIRFRQGKFFFSEDPEDKGVEEFEGVIYFHGKQNTYWAGSYDSNNVTPPECFSPDGKTGSKARTPDGEFGSCRDCKYNQFGSGVGKGKACRNQIKLYIQRLGTTVPMALFLAPTSIGAFSKGYLMDKITQKGLSYFKVITKFKAYQQGSETYFRVNFEIAGIFKGEEAATVKELRSFWLPAIKNDRSRMENVEGDEQGNPSSSSSSSSSPSSSGTNDRVVAPREPAPVPASAADVDDDDDDDVPF